MTKYKINKIIAAELVERGVWIRADVSRDGAVHFDAIGAMGSDLDMFVDSRDSCALFEDSLTIDEKWRYGIEIKQLSYNAAEYYDDPLFLFAAFLTPAQRCEVFLRTIDKWETK